MLFNTTPHQCRIYMSAVRVSVCPAEHLAGSAFARCPPSSSRPLLACRSSCLIDCTTPSMSQLPDVRTSLTAGDEVRSTRRTRQRVSLPHSPASAQERATVRTFGPSGGRSLRWPWRFSFARSPSRWTHRLHAMLNRHAWEVREVSDSNVRSWGACRPRVRAHMHTRDTMCASMSFALPVRVRARTSPRLATLQFA